MHDDQFKKINDFLSAVLKLIRFLKLYPHNHPNLQDVMNKAEAARETFFMEESYLKVGILGGVMFIGKEAIEKPNTMIKGLINLLGQVKIKSFEMDNQVDQAELFAFCKLCASDKDTLLADEGKGDFDPEVLKREEFHMPHIKINDLEVSFGDEGGGGDGSISNVDEALGFLMGKIDNIMERTSLNADQVDGRMAQRGFDEIGDMLSSQCDNLQDLKKGLLLTINKLSPDAQASIFGESLNDEADMEMDQMLLNLSVKSRANVLRNELKRKEFDVEKLKEEMGVVVNEGGEVVELAEMIAKEFGLTAESEEEKQEYISRLSSLVQSGLVTKGDVMGTTQGPTRVKGTILIAEDDTESIAVYKRYLHSAGFDTLIYTDGKEALEGIKEHKPDIILLDLKLPSLHGLDIIYFLRKNKEYRVPVIICTAYDEFKNEFEIRSYPKVEYLPKPLPRDKFLEAVERFAPEISEEELQAQEEERELSNEELQIQEDMEKARGVQAKLLPESLPDLVGFDVGTFYCSCKDVGGDYFDIIPIDNDHIGFMVADVSGKGVSGAMVMVMIRSVLKLVAPNSISPRQTLIDTNALIAKDMKLGMFVTCLYMVLNEKSREITVCCAGHNPAAIWRQKTSRVDYMKPSGMALGITDSPVFRNSLKEEKIMLGTYDRVVTYTDGVVEAMSPDYEEYGEDRLADLIKTNAAKSSEDLIDIIYQDLMEFEDTAPRHDDVTIVTIRAI